MLLGHQALDPGRDVFVAHATNRKRWHASGYDRLMARPDALVDEIANELATWPGVRIERGEGGAAVVRYEHSTLGFLHPDRGVVELPVLDSEHDELVDAGEAEPAPDSGGVSHGVHGPADVTEVLELFDRRYRDVRGEDSPYSSEDPGWSSPGV